MLKLTQIRNATILVEIGGHRLLVDPFLADVGTLPGLRFFRGERRRNPLVPLPEVTDACLASATGVLVTHRHPDHLDPAGMGWIRSRKLTVWSSPVEVPSLRGSGFDARPLAGQELDLAAEITPASHGRGLLGWLMGPVCGFYLEHTGSPSVYLTGDTVLTPAVREVVDRLRPDVVVAPAGAANFGIGGDILFSVDELVELARVTRGTLVLNHLETMDHCPVTRDALRSRFAQEGLGDRIAVPDDGETVEFGGPVDGREKPVRGCTARPGFQKWLTDRFNPR